MTPRELPEVLPADMPGPPPPPRGVIPDGPAGSYALLALAAAGAISLWFFLRGWGWVTVAPALLGLLAVAGRVGLAAPLFVVLTLVGIGLTEEWGRRLIRPGSLVKSLDWLPALGLLAFLAAHARFVGLTRRQFQGTAFDRVRVPWRATAAPPRRWPQSVPAWEPWIVPLTAAGWLLAGGLWEATVPRGFLQAGYYDLSQVEARTLVFVWLLAVAVVLAVGGLAVARWRRLGPREAGVYLRSVGWRWFERELGALERYSARRQPGPDGPR
jgi:hypothetical protein